MSADELHDHQEIEKEKKKRRKKKHMLIKIVVGWKCRKNLQKEVLAVFRIVSDLCVSEAAGAVKQTL